MKLFLQIYKPYMLRPIFYKVVARFVTGLVFALIWDRFVNTQKTFSMVERAFFFLAVVFFGLAWVNYLRLDGVKLHHLNENRKKTKHKMKFPIDFTDEEPSPNDVLDESEIAVATLISNIVTGLCFLLPSLASLAFRR